MFECLICILYIILYKLPHIDDEWISERERASERARAWNCRLSSENFYCHSIIIHTLRHHFGLLARQSTFKDTNELFRLWWITSAGRNRMNHIESIALSAFTWFCNQKMYESFSFMSLLVVICKNANEEIINAIISLAFVENSVHSQTICLN